MSVPLFKTSTLMDSKEEEEGGKKKDYVAEYVEFGKFSVLGFLTSHSR